MEALKARTWVGVLWPDSMVDNWENLIELCLQVPFVYIVHDRDVNKNGETKKTHIHCMVCYGNTTTERNISTLFNRLAIPGKQCCNRVFAVTAPGYMVDYFCHDTPAAQRENKTLYSKDKLVFGLGWDTSLIQEQTIIDKYSMITQLSTYVVENKISNYADLYMTILNKYDMGYFQILVQYSGHFERLTKSMYLKSLSMVK